jgi:hypothetical protein
MKLVVDFANVGENRDAVLRRRVKGGKHFSHVHQMQTDTEV